MGSYHNIHLYRKPRSTRLAALRWAVEGEALRKDQIACGEWTEDDQYRVSCNGETVFGPVSFPRAWMWMFDHDVDANGLLIHPVAPTQTETLECTCTPLSVMACPACIHAVETRYGAEVPF